MLKSSIARPRFATARACDPRSQQRTSGRQQFEDDVLLPEGSGTWRPGARSDHYTLFGPAGDIGSPAGFQMHRAVQGQHPGLVPYTQPEPPIVHTRAGLQMWGQLLMQSDPISHRDDALKLLNPPPTAGVHTFLCW